MARPPVPAPSALIFVSPPKNQKCSPSPGPWVMGAPASIVSIRQACSQRAAVTTPHASDAAEVLILQPGDGRLEAGRIVDACLPAEQLSRFAIAEILVFAQYVHGLSREQRRCRETRRLVQE